MLGGDDPLSQSLASVEYNMQHDLHILLGTANSNRSFKLLPKMSVKVGRLLLPWRGLVSIPPAPVVPFAS
jgi:hypothetical protein